MKQTLAIRITTLAALSLALEAQSTSAAHGGNPSPVPGRSVITTKSGMVGDAANGCDVGHTSSRARRKRHRCRHRHKRGARSDRLTRLMFCARAQIYSRHSAPPVEDERRALRKPNSMRAGVPETPHARMTGCLR